jgi:hypothetical protein
MAKDDKGGNPLEKGIAFEVGEVHTWIQTPGDPQPPDNLRYCGGGAAIESKDKTRGYSAIVSVYFILDGKPLKPSTIEVSDGSLLVATMYLPLSSAAALIAVTTARGSRIEMLGQRIEFFRFDLPAGGKSSKLVKRGTGPTRMTSKSVAPLRNAYRKDTR